MGRKRARRFHRHQTWLAKAREELDRTAIWSHWGNVKLKGGLEEGLSIIIYMGLEQKGWIWVFPIGQTVSLPASLRRILISAINSVS